MKQKARMSRMILLHITHNTQPHWRRFFVAVVAAAAAAAQQLIFGCRVSIDMNFTFFLSSKLELKKFFRNFNTQFGVFVRVFFYIVSWLWHFFVLLRQIQ